jgi:hypothetical protein
MNFPGGGYACFTNRKRGLLPALAVGSCQEIPVKRDFIQRQNRLLLNVGWIDELVQ